MNTLSIIIAIIVGGAAGYFLTNLFFKKEVEDSQKKASDIISKAKKEAEIILKEAEVQSKDKIFKVKAELEKEIKEKKDELLALEKRLFQKEENLAKKDQVLAERELEIVTKEKEINSQVKELTNQISEYEKKTKQIVKELEKISNITQEEAKQILMEKMEEEAKFEVAKKLKEIEDEYKENANKKAQEILALAIQRYASDFVVEKTVSVVHLPNEEMKGRIIGREGRNIRTLETLAGVDLIIDDTPEAVVVSCFDPVRREIARLSLEKLIEDGRIHPARIEEIVNLTKKEIEEKIKEYGQKALFEVGLHRMHPELIRLIGRLYYRTSYGQNIYQHSIETSYIAGIIASELGLDVKKARRAGLLHDIGKAVDHEIQGSHAAIGADLAKKYGEDKEIVNAIASHHDEVDKISIYSVITQAADALSGARPGARGEMYESYIKRLEELEKIASDFEGVTKSYAIQAGREVRVFVENDKINDEHAFLLAKDIAKKVEENLTYPGQIKVTVIREMRAVEYAR
jgi:ribonuclease Y